MKVERKNITSFLGNIDIYLCSSGFEERSTFLGINLNRTQVSEAFIFHIEDTYKVSEDHLEAIKKNLSNLITISYAKNAPLTTYDKFYQLFFELIKSKNDNRIFKVVIDITTFTIEVLLILIKLLSSEIFVNTLNVFFVYTPAESYSNNDKNIWLTKGIRDIRSVLGYSGMHSPSKQLLLILLSGFEE